MDVRILEINSLKDAEKHIINIGADPASVRLMAQKSVIRSLLIESIDNRAANILKQDMLSLGGEAAVSREVSMFRRGESDVLIFATERQCKALVAKLDYQPFGLKNIAEKINSALLNYEMPVYKVPCGKHDITLGKRALVMGILNVTPDSFSDGGLYCDTGLAAARAEEMQSCGADIIDIGGESTRPGAKPVASRDEARRVVPVISAIVKRLKSPVSIDTYKPEVAAAALDAGASIVNDISGLRYKNGAMAAVVRGKKIPVIVMHMQGTPRSMQKAPHYKDVVADICGFFKERMEFAAGRGISLEQLIFDPGIGFGKTLEHNLDILRRLKEFRILGRPVAVGVSRKWFIGKLTGEEKPTGRTAGSIAAAAASAINGAHILRVHDVLETAQALKVIEAIRR